MIREFTETTKKIIDAHKGDFDCTNYKTKMKDYGAYLSSLGGVFKRWAEKTADVKTVYDLYEIAEYVFGLMSIFGFDYNNGKWYRKWAGGKPFYIGNHTGRSNWGRIDDLCGKASKDKTTNCNYGMDSLLYKAGLFGGKDQPTNSSAFRSHIKSRKSPFFRHQKDLQVGDLVHFFRSPVTTDDCNDWKDWGHVAIVGEVINGEIILFDSGGRFITTGHYKHEFKVDEHNKPIGDYSTYKGWVGIRDIHLQGSKDDLVKDRTNTDLAVGVILGLYDKDSKRKHYLGNRYEIVQKLVNHYTSDAGHDDYLIACAYYVIAGYAGKGERRRDIFGKDYVQIQKIVNRILSNARKTESVLALEVINGVWGSGDARRNKLIKAGHDYEEIQKKVNQMLVTG